MNTVDPACLPEGRAPDDIIKFLFGEWTPSAPPSLEFLTYFLEDFLDGLVFQPSLARFLAVYGPPERQSFLGVGDLLFASKLIWEGLIPPPE